MTTATATENAARAVIQRMFALQEELKTTRDSRKPEIYEAIDKCLDRLNEIKAAACSTTSSG